MTRFKEILPKVLPTGAALLLFFIVSALYFAPQFRGEVLPQHDVQQYEGMAKEIWDNRAQTGEDPQWAGRMFGGMPAYLINVAYPAQLVKNTAGQIVKIINTPAAFVFFAMVSMWLMLLIVGVNPWVGIIPSLMYGLSTYFFLIIGAGHVTKMWALVYAPLMMGGAWLTLRSNMWLGGALTALFASLEIGANHPQITYYFLLAMAALWISEGIVAFRKKHLPSFARRTAVLLGAGILAVGSNFAPLWYTMHHSKQTIRGGSELAAGEETSQEGLALDYATAWSYGRAESWNLLIPDFMGGDSGRAFTRDGEMAKALKPYGLESFAEQLPAYWGEQPYTAGPTYLGAAALFLALLGLLLASGRNKWWIAAVSLLTLLLAWGHNFMGFTEFAFKYLPGYNKFRTVSMALVVVEWTVPLLAALALMPLWRGEVPRRKLLRALAWAGGITGGFCLLFAVAGSAIFDFGRTEAADFMSRQYYQMFQAAGMQEAIAQGAPEELGEVTADAMAAEFQVDRVAVRTGDVADGGGHVAQTVARTGRVNAGGERLLGALDELEVARVGVVADHEADGGVADPAVDADGQIKADEVPVLEVVVERDAMQHCVVDRRADVVCERAGAEVRRIIHVARFGALAVDDLLVHVLVDLQQVGADLRHGLEFLENLADETTGRLHLLDFLSGFQFDHATQPTVRGLLTPRTAELERADHRGNTHDDQRTSAENHQEQHRRDRRDQYDETGDNRDDRVQHRPAGARQAP